MDSTDETLPEKRGRGRPRSQAAVIDATLDLIWTAEARTVTMEAIAERAGISKVTLYRRWPSKAALMADALLSYISDVVPLDITKPPMTALTEHAHGLCLALDSQVGRIFRIVAAECIADPATMVTFRDRYIGNRRRTGIQIIARGFREGSFTAATEPENCHDAIYGTIFYRFLFGLDGTDPRAIDELLATVLKPVPTPEAALPAA